jgi:hypothetical protein
MSAYAGASSSAPLARVSHKHPCPVCGHTDWCSYWTDNRGAICMRIKSDKTTRDGLGWIHLFDVPSPHPTTSPRSTTAPKIVMPPRASVERRHAIYTALLNALDLTIEHRESLELRGLARTEIARLQLKSVPTAMAAVSLTRALSQRFDLCGLPGFFQDREVWRMVSITQGFFVPYYDEQGRIEGLQVRRWPYAGDSKYIWLSSKDRPFGSSSGAPINFARPELLDRASEVLITEGGLKSQIISYFTQSPVIAAAGVSNFGAGFGMRLRKRFPTLHCAVIAFDKDALDKPQVNHALMSLTAQLEHERFDVRIRIWPSLEKGYDDYLLSQLRQQEKRA